jgi:hypothetical protein
VSGLGAFFRSAALAISAAAAIRSVVRAAKPRRSNRSKAAATIRSAVCSPLRARMALIGRSATGLLDASR